MALSARNQFPGTVVSIKGGAVMAEVVIDIGGGHRIVSLISASSVKRLKLKKGSPAVAVKGDRGHRLHRRGGGVTWRRVVRSGGTTLQVVSACCGPRSGWRPAGCRR